MLNFLCRLFVIESAIEFTKTLSNLEVTEKQTATFECEVSKGDQVASWFQLEDKIESGTGDWEKFKTEVSGQKHRLIIDNVELEDAKKYTCSIKDKKTSAILTVNGESFLAESLLFVHPIDNS